MMNSLGSLRLFVLCFCGIGAVLAIHSQDRAAVTETGSALYDRNHHSRLTRRAGSGDPFQTFHPPVSYTTDKRTPALPTTDPLHSVLQNFNYNQDISAKSDPTFRHIWPEKEFSSHTNDAIDNVDQLNWREAQLARLHGLGPAEIAALSSWQHRLKLHAFNKRLSESQDPIVSTTDRMPHPLAYRPWMQLAETTKTNVITHQEDPFKQVDQHKSNDVQIDEDDNETNNALSLSLWSKRSPRSGKGKEKNPNNRKEGSSETSNKGNGKGKSGSRKSESNHRITEQTMNKDNAMTSDHYEHGSHENNGRDRGREGAISSTPVVDSVNRMNRNLATQFLLRSPRENHQYDVPVIECSIAQDGMERFACPTPDRMGRYRCIDDHVLCDGFIDCPGAEDEDGQACMFYKTMKAHLDVVADALLRWVRGR